MKHRFLGPILAIILPPVSIGAYVGLDSLLALQPKLAAFFDRIIMSAFPEPGLMTSFQNQVLGVCGALLAVCFTIVVVVYSVSEIDRYVVRQVILLNWRTSALLFLFFSAVITNGYLALWALTRPAVAYGQVFLLLEVMIVIHRYFLWFSKSLSLSVLSEMVTEAHYDSMEKLKMLALLVRNASKRDSQYDIERTFNAFVDFTAHTYLALKDRGADTSQVRQFFFEELTEEALSSVQNKNHGVMERQIGGIYRLANMMPLDEDEDWASSTMEWMKRWHMENLRSSEYGAFSNPVFNTVFLYLEELFIRRYGSLSRKEQN